MRVDLVVVGLHLGDLLAELGELTVGGGLGTAASERAQARSKRRRKAEREDGRKTRRHRHQG